MDGLRSAMECCTRDGYKRGRMQVEKASGNYQPDQRFGHIYSMIVADLMRIASTSPIGAECRQHEPERRCTEAQSETCAGLSHIRGYRGITMMSRR
jgi:hypothetical protein